MPRYDRWRKHRRHHAKTRAAERYQVRLTDQDLVNIVGLIRNRKATATRPVSNSKSLKRIVYRDIDMIVLYSHRHHEVITFLPADCWELKTLEDACA